MQADFKRRSQMKMFMCLMSVLLMFCIGRISAQQITPQTPEQAQAAPVTQWPQQITGPAGPVTIYQPQPTQFEGDTLTARAAVSMTMAGSSEPVFGAMWFTAQVWTDRDARTVTIKNITIKQVKLPNATADQEKQFGQLLEQQAPSMNLMLSLDQLESTLGIVQKEREEARTLDNNPPKIVFTTTPTTLVTLDGPPKLQASQTPGVMVVINTPFIMLQDMGSKQYFLKAGDTWMVAPDVMGPWTVAGAAVPPGVLDAGSKLSPQTAPPQATTPPPGPTQILVADEPTEVISCQGQPTYAPIVGNDLLYMTNTESDVFLEVSSQQYFVLLSGRWFTSKSMEGPWTNAPPDKLPPSFAQIPADSPKANVLVSVAGTQQAQDARLDAHIPQTSAINRDAGADVNVSYDGNPQFTPVQDVPITYATNCDIPVFCVNNGYYCCNQAVWYRSNAATGPWTVCDSVPGVIYTIPPSCPFYYCRYCYVYGSTPQVVYCGYLPGYTGCYVYGGTVIYGTGYTYPFWFGTRFICHPWTWGFGARYDYYAGMWGYGAGFLYTPGWFAARHDRHDWFGPQGYVDYREMHTHYNRAGLVSRNEVRNVAVTRVNIYNRQENVKRNVFVHNEVRNDVRETPRNEPAQRAAPRPENNVFVGPNGEVYRRSENGWETRSDKGWTAYKEPEHAQPQVHQEEHQPAVNNPPREEPARQEPQRQAPVQQEPRHVENPPGMEQEYNARERGNPAPEPSHVEQRGGGGGNGGGGGRR